MIDVVLIVISLERNRLRVKRTAAAAVASSASAAEGAAACGKKAPEARPLWPSAAAINDVISEATAHWTL